MARLFQVEIQVIVDDNIDAYKVEDMLNNALASTKVVDNIYVREVNYVGNLEEDFSEDL